jgi:hypothetical protein
MSNRERPNVKNAKNFLQFPEIEWIPIAQFKSIVSEIKIEPFITQPNGKLMYIGKGIPASNLYQPEQNRIELIGSVIQNELNEWEIFLPYGGGTTRQCDNFKVLNIPNKNDYEWITSSDGNVPEYALRGAMDNNIREYLYIGKVIKNLKQEAYYFSYYDWHVYSNKIDITFGKIHSSHHCLYAPTLNDDKEIYFKNYQVLCLKPLEFDRINSLKRLCQLFLRNILNDDNRKIDILKENIPLSLVDYLKHSTVIKQGDFLFKGDKLATEDSNYLLFINDYDTITCRELSTNKEIYFQLNIESICLLKQGIYLTFSDSIRFRPLLAFNDYYSDYNLKLLVSNSGFDTEQPLKFLLVWPNNRQEEVSFGAFHSIQRANASNVHDLTF